MTTPTESVSHPSPDGDASPDATAAGWRTVLRRRWWAFALALLAVVALVISVVAITRDDQATAPSSSAVPTAPTVTQTPTDGPTTAPPTAPTTAKPVPTTVPAPDGDLAGAVWPAAGSDRHYTDPVAVTRGFAIDYLGFTDPVISPFRQGDTRSGEVDIRPRPDGPVTTAAVRELGRDSYWYVLGAGTDTIDVTAPEWNAEITAPVTVTGQAHAFEGTVNVEVRRDGQTRPIGQGTVTGGGTEMLAFTGQIAFTAVTAGRGALVFFELSPADGSVTKATVVRVQLRGEQ
jgi:hypothetical protein